MEDTKDLDVTNILDKSKKFVRLYEKAYNFNSTRFADYAELMAFYQGNQHLLTKYKTNRPWVVNMNTPYAAVAIENRTSSLKANDYEGDLLPLSPEDIDIVEPLDKLQKREWERMNIDKLVDDSLDMGAVVREAYCHIYVDKDKIVGGKGNKRVGALCAELIEPARVLIDPDARRLKDANYVVVTGRTTKKIAYKQYPILETFAAQGSTYPADMRGEIYYDNDYNTEQDDVLTVWNFYVKEDGKVKKTRLINSIIVSEETIDTPEIPIAQFRWKKAAQSCYGISLMDQLLSLQKAVCSIESAITNTAIAYAAPSMMVAKGCGVDPKQLAISNGAPGIVYSVTGDLNNAMKPVVPPKIQEEILSIKTDFENKIKEISGNSSQFLGDIGTAANTAGGTQLAIDRAKIIEVGVTSNLQEYVEDIVNILVDFLVKLYPGKVLSYYTGKNGDGLYTFDKIKMPSEKKLSDLQYRFYIELDKKSPYSKEKQKQNLMDLFQFERQYDTPIKTITVSDIIKNSDLENKEEIIQRFNNLTYQDAQTKAETIEKMIMVGTEMGAAQDLITASISEIISNAQETPATDELMQLIEQGFQSQLDEANQMADMGALPQNQTQVTPETADPQMMQDAMAMVNSGQVGQ